MRQYFTIPALITAIIIFFTSCTNNTIVTDKKPEVEDNMILITQEQFNNEGMEIGEISNHYFEDVVSCNGIISAPVNGIAHISSQFEGIVKTINYSIGDHVEQGDVICTLASNELIVIQQEYLQTSAKLHQLEVNYKRSKALYAENIGAQKDLISKESEYNALAAEHQSLKLQLKLLNLDIEKIKRGDLYTTFPILAPISGYITKMDVVLGKFIEPQTQMMELVDISSLQLQLSVFVVDINNISPGQSVTFKLLGESKNEHQAILKSIGKTINSNSKTIHCIANIIYDNQYEYTNGSYIEAKIITESTTALALPEEAIIKSGENYYVLVVDEIKDDDYFLRKEKIEIGRKLNGYAEITSSTPLNKVVTQGVYNLQIE